MPVLTSPGVEVTIIDESQYLPAPTGTVPLVVVATAQNKATPTGTGVAQATTAANANKLFQVTSQRDLVTLYGTPFFYTTSNGTPIQGYELNEYGLLAAYSLLGVSNRCYVLRADIDLASLVGQTGRPAGAPNNGTYWLDTTNTMWGFFEWNATTQQFTEKTPIVITDAAYINTGVPVSSLGNIGDYAVNAIEIMPTPSNSSQKEFFFKNQDNIWVALGSSDWMNSWPTIISSATNPTLVAGNFTIALSGSSYKTATIVINPGDTISDVASAINSLNWTYVYAQVQSGKLQIFSKQQNGLVNQYLAISGTTSTLTSIGISAGNYYQPAIVYGTAAQMPLWSSSQSYPHPSGSVWLKQGEAGNGFAPVMSVYNTNTARWITKNVTLATSDVSAINSLDASGGKNIPQGTIYAKYNFGGNTSGYGRFGSSPTYFYERLVTGPTVVTGENTDPIFMTPDITAGNFTIGKYYVIKTQGDTAWTLIGAANDNVGTTFIATGVGTGTGTAALVDFYPLMVYVSVPNAGSMSGPYQVGLMNGDDATAFVTSWSAANIPWTTASITSNGAIQITHTEGGVIAIYDYVTDPDDTLIGSSQGIIDTIGITADVTTGAKYGSSIALTYPVESTGTSGAGSGLYANITSTFGFYTINSVSTAGSGYQIGDFVTFPGTAFGGISPGNDLIAVVTSVASVAGDVDGLTFYQGTTLSYPVIELSNWVVFDYTANEGAPTQNPANNTNWFYSVVDQVDIMVNTPAGWRGYRNKNYDQNGFPTPSGTNTTDPNGPIISASEPTTQSDGTALSWGDLWINTSNLENYPVIYRWQYTSAMPSGQWVLIDNSDQTSSSGVLFADARWATNGDTDPINDPIPTIVSLLTSNYLDLDAPESSLYPVGMLLFNTRRSGYNVKQFKSNYFNAVNFPDQSLPTVTNAWVTASGLMSNGAPYMGRKAQRNMVVEALRSAIDTNTDIRDEDNFFNLLATPNYPELQPNMVVLNADRGDTGYILGDTPLGLPDDATQIQAWATNAAGATSTGEEGCVTRDTYLGLFYPSGIAFDLNGNEVVVPASHMMLRTFIRNDNVAYPWFAAAGTRRGIIDNAANIGYLNRTTGEFVTIKTRIGIRDVLYTNFINPLVFFTGNGLLNYGNKTSYNSQSALDRTNVARLVAFIRRQLTLAARPFVFEPNDSITRKQIAGVIESLMIDLVAKRGIYDYLVVCDESNNIPSRIDRNELWVDVAIEPVKAAEFIYIPVRILNTGELAAL